MSNILSIKLGKPVSDSVDSKGWQAVCETARKDFTSSGFAHLAEEFLEEFKPYYDELKCDLAAPSITADTEQHRIWKQQLDEMILAIQHHTGRLVRDRYLRELTIFCEKNIK